MYRHFAPAEFSYFHPLSWLKQFKAAMRIRKISPRDALNALVDMDLERWQSICDNIEDIDLVRKAIEFLGNSLEQSVTCCKDLHRKIELTIQVAKLAAFEKSSLRYRIKVDELKEQLEPLEEDLSRIESRINDIKIQLENFEGSKQQKAELQKEIHELNQARGPKSFKIQGLKSEINVITNTIDTLRPI